MPIFSLKKQTIVFGNKVDMFHHHMTVSTCRISLYMDKVYLDFVWQFASLNCFYCMFCVAGFCLCPKRWSGFPCGQWISCTAVSCLGCRYLLFFRFYILLIVKTDLLTVQVVWSRWLDICLVIFCVFYSVTSTNKNAKKELGRYPAVLTAHLVNNDSVFPSDDCKSITISWRRWETTSKVNKSQVCFTCPVQCNNIKWWILLSCVWRLTGISL